MYAPDSLLTKYIVIKATARKYTCEHCSDYEEDIPSFHSFDDQLSALIDQKEIKNKEESEILLSEISRLKEKITFVEEMDNKKINGYKDELT